MPSDKHHEGSQAVWLEEAFPEQHQTSTLSKDSRGSDVIFKWIHPEVKPGIEQYSNYKDLARVTMRETNSRESHLVVGKTTGAFACQRMLWCLWKRVWTPMCSEWALPRSLGSGFY